MVTIPMTIPSSTWLRSGGFLSSDAVNSFATFGLLIAAQKSHKLVIEFLSSNCSITTIISNVGIQMHTIAPLIHPAPNIDG